MLFFFYMKKLLGMIIVIIVLGFVWYLGSPLILDKVANDDFPELTTEELLDLQKMAVELGIDFEEDITASLKKISWEIFLDTHNPKVSKEGTKTSLGKLIVETLLMD